MAQHEGLFFSCDNNEQIVERLYLFVAIASSIRSIHNGGCFSMK